MVLREVRIVALDGSTTDPGPVDVRVRAGRVVELGPALEVTADDEVIEAEGRWLMPGLWDHHVHLTQWGAQAARLDTAGADSPEEVCRRVAVRVACTPPGATIVGWGHRFGGWPRRPTVAELDAVSGATPVVLIAGDGHHGWLNTAALSLLGLSGVTGVLDEDDWFPLYRRVADLPGVAQAAEAGVGAVMEAAAGLGVVGVVDLEFDRPHALWPERVARGLNQLRVRAGVYEGGLDEVIDLGLCTGDIVEGTEGLVTMGPLKVISDGSLNTRTAYCCEPYADALPGEAFPRGKLNTPLAQLTSLLTRARVHAIEIALHAIGDAAIASGIQAIRSAGQRGSIEHAQLIRREDIQAMAELGVVASVQPAHLLDDRDPTMRLWPDRSDRCFMFRSMLDAGVRLAFGSDAPVSPLDPWLAMAAAVHRSADEREPWHPEEAISTREALLASTDGHDSVRVGSLADLILLDDDPLRGKGDDSADAAAYLRGLRVEATFVGGRATHSRFFAAP